jgi:hypothetical protein
MTLSDSVSKATSSASKSLSNALNTADKKYKEMTNHGSSRSSLSNNSGFHSDARTVAQEAERLKDKALRDVDRRF